MEKLFNWISITAGALGGITVKLLGGWDALILTLVMLVVFDYITGFIKAIYTKQLSSEIGYKGIIKKVMIFILVMVSCVINRLTSGAIPLRETVIMFFAVNEALSLVENISEVIPVPPSLKKVLLQLREKNGIADDSESDN